MSNIFTEQVARKPDKYPWTSDFINAMWAGHWTPNEFNFRSDIQNFKTELSPKEQEIVTKTLSAIGQIEIAVKKFWAKIGDHLPHPSITDMGLVMAQVEVIHNRAYEKLLDVLGLTDAFENNLKIDVITKRVKYLKKYLEKNYQDDKKQFVYALILFTLFVENVSLFSQFYIILWFNRYKNVLKDTAQQVHYTTKEEDIHAKIGIKLVNTIRKECPELFDDELKNKIETEAKEAFGAESKIIDWILGDFSDERINSHTVKQYIKHRINKSMVEIGYSVIYNDISEEDIRDFEWMDEESTANMATDFFFQRPIEYQKINDIFEEDLF